ncbi:MAG TPA: oxygen-dependent coproporphyrinogen oxidase [Puia sp.]|nr:oxygen-dependent coproporphyrinogen oxidase [Puia sp.]
MEPEKMLYKTATHPFRDRWISYIHQLQDNICQCLEDIDGHTKFITDEWKREGGGGGTTRVIEEGAVFEKGGVNTSVVWGNVTDAMRAQLKIGSNVARSLDEDFVRAASSRPSSSVPFDPSGTSKGPPRSEPSQGSVPDDEPPVHPSKWFAAGLSLVIHPLNPYVPTTHANWRYFELYDEQGNVTDRWFGGGSDLTPYYLFEEDAQHFHGTLKNAMDPFGKEKYPQYKRWCDEYFVNKHRSDEMRGIGGVFYDHLRPADEAGAEELLAFQQAGGNAFVSAYTPIVLRRKDTPYGAREKEWQEIRRGRYVEFNLVHDRGTLFGLRTQGRTESILMSLPPRARWVYNYQPHPGTPEADLLDACLHPREWTK